MYFIHSIACHDALLYIFCPSCNHLSPRVTKNWVESRAVVHLGNSCMRGDIIRERGHYSREGTLFTCENVREGEQSQNPHIFWCYALLAPRPEQLPILWKSYRSSRIWRIEMALFAGFARKVSVMLHSSLLSHVSKEWVPVRLLLFRHSFAYFRSKSGVSSTRKNYYIWHQSNILKFVCTMTGFVCTRNWSSLCRSMLCWYSQRMWNHRLSCCRYIYSRGLKGVECVFTFTIIHHYGVHNHQKVCQNNCLWRSQVCIESTRTRWTYLLEVWEKPELQWVSLYSWRWDNFTERHA